MITRQNNTTYRLPLEKYNQLANTLKDAGCLQKTPLKYTALTLFTLLGISLSLYLVTSTDNFWYQVINALVFGFLTVQLGLISHDLSHQSVFVSGRLNRSLALVFWTLGCGLSESRWYHKHNAHHQSPNHEGHDPDLDIPFVFDHQQAIKRSTFEKRWLFPHQSILFWIGIWLVYPYNIINSTEFIAKNFTHKNLVELIFIIIHFLVLFLLIFIFLPKFTALVFLLVSFATIGIYMGLIFAPNHKGEDLLGSDEEFNWVHQITLTRNIKPTLFNLYIYGGLGNQIEHHLFPKMSRFQQLKAAVVVQKFCSEHELPYQEVSWVESMRKIHNSLKEESLRWK